MTNTGIPWAASKRMPKKSKMPPEPPAAIATMKTTIVAMGAFIELAIHSEDIQSQRTFLRRIGACAHGLVADIQEELKS